jgi:hypothetical protein
MPDPQIRIPPERFSNTTPVECLSEVSMPYRFYYLDKTDKIIDLTEGDYSNETEAVAIAEINLAITPHEAVEVWQMGKMIYRGSNDKFHL